MVKKSKKKKSSSLNFIVILFALVCVAYIYRYFAFKIDTEMVKYDSMENAVATQCLLIKNEWTMPLPGDAAADYKVNEGDRVSIGKPILKVSENGGADENISLKIDKINERINEIKKAEADNNFFATDKEKIDASIRSSLNELKAITASNDLSRLEEVKNKLSADMYKKSLVAGTASFSGQNLEQLEKEKANLEEIQRSNIDVVYARTSGLVSYELDGYEDALKPENIKALSVDNLESIYKEIKDKKKDKKATQPEGVKVVDNFEWYIASIIPSGILSKEDVGKSIKVRFKDQGGAVVNGTLTHFDLGNEKGNLIVVKTDEQLKDFQRIRISDVEIITKHSEGLIVPSRSITEKDGLKGVFIERNGIARFVPIKIVIANEEEALVVNLGNKDKGFDTKNYVLKPYDRIIISINKVKEDQMLPGAF